MARFIDAEWLKNKCNEICDEYSTERLHIDRIWDEIDDAPDVEVVRCKECKHHMTIHCTCDGCCISDDWYCADGERKNDGT